MPLTAECKKILNLAAETAERLGHRYVETEHLLIGILRVEESMAAQILVARGIKPGPFQEQVGKTSAPQFQATARASAVLNLHSFLTGLTSLNPDELILFFAKNAQFVDVQGKPWNREEIEKEFATLFAPYAKKNATYAIEQTLADTADVFVAIVLWKNAILASLERVWIHRMSVVLVPEGDDWQIVLVQVTPVKLS